MKAAIQREKAEFSKGFPKAERSFSLYSKLRTQKMLPRLTSVLACLSFLLELGKT